jgi:MYXO-CTERM domain-containing protein
MHFIEQVFGFSPDGGSGLTEMLFLILPIAGLVVAAILRRRRSTSATRL